MLLSVRDISVTRRSRKVVQGISLDIAPGEFIGLIGPNGAGKTSLLRAALGLLAHEGHSSLAMLPPGRRAQMAAFLPQGRQIAWPVTVERLVALGRIPHGAAPGDAAAIDRAITALGLDEMRHRPATQLSGGEQARALIARAMAQETPLLVADEPIAGLDPAAQIAAMRVFAARAAAGGAVIASLHDLGLAARHCSRLILLDRGRIVAEGPPAEVLTPDHIGRVFGISAHFADTAQGPVFQPLDLLPARAR